MRVNIFYSGRKQLYNVFEREVFYEKVLCNFYCVRGGVRHGVAIRVAGFARAPEFPQHFWCRCAVVHEPGRTGGSAAARDPRIVDAQRGIDHVQEYAMQQGRSGLCGSEDIVRCFVRKGSEQGACCRPGLSFRSFLAALRRWKLPCCGAMF